MWSIELSLFVVPVTQEMDTPALHCVVPDVSMEDALVQECVHVIMDGQDSNVIEHSATQDVSMDDARDQINAPVTVAGEAASVMHRHVLGERGR
jgi:hypothetical protein